MILTNYKRELIPAAISGLVLKHREAQKGILQFFERFVQLVSYWAADSPLAISERDFLFFVHYQCTLSPWYFSDTLALVNKYAPPLVNTLLIMLSGHMPAYALDESNGCISDVLWYLRKRLLSEFRVCSIYIILDFKRDFGFMFTYLHLLSQNWIVQLLPNLSQDAQAIAKQHDLVNRLTEDSATQKSFASILDRFAASCRRSI